MRIPQWLAAAISLFAASVSADVWMADDRFVLRLSPGTDAVELSLDSPRSRALAVDPRDGAVWILSDTRLARRSRVGAVLVDADLKTLRMEGATFLSLDARDGSVWLGEGRGTGKDAAKIFVRIDSSGQIAGSLPSPGDARALSVALDGSIWILGQKRLLHYTSTGSLLADVDLKPLVNGEPKLLQVDSIGAWLWASAEKRLIRIDAHSLMSTPLSTELAKQPDSIALDGIRGTLWALSEQRLDAVSVGGSPVATVDLKSLGITQPDALAFDPVSRTTLVGHGAGLARFGPEGRMSGLVPNPRRVQAIGVAPLVVETALALASPGAGAVTNDPLVPVALQLRASCSGSDCGIAIGFYEGYSLSVLLSGQQVGTLFTIDRDTGLATYRPSSRLPEGTVTVAATATDGFGQTSSELSASFTVDTTPPSFLSLSPASPHLTNRTRVPVSGRLSEPSSLLIGAAVVPVAPDGTFAAEQDVSEGMNAIVLQATDPAGNRAAQTISVTRDTVAPKFSSLTPPDGSVFGSAAVAINGTVDEPADIAVAWSGAPQSATGQAFRFPVSLVPGPNAFRVTATDRAGNSTEKRFTVTYAPLAIAVTDPPDGFTTTSDSLTVTGTFSGPPNTRVTVNGVDATQSGGTFSSQVALALGANSIAIVATSPDGAATSTSLQVSRSTGAPPPTITFFSPADGDTFVAPASMQVTAGATNADGSRAFVTVSNSSLVGFSAGAGEGDLTEYFWNEVPEGIYEIVAAVTDSYGTATTKTITVTVLPDPAEIPFRDIWKGLVAALRAGDQAGALAFLTDGAKERYAPVFATLQADMGAIFDSVQSIRGVSLNEYLAEFAVTRQIDGELNVFFIYFAKDGTGQWKLDSM